MIDHDLRDAVRALRDEAGGVPDAANATRMRILSTVRARRRRNVTFVRATAVLLAAAFGGVAWAAATGRLPPLSALLVDASDTNRIQSTPAPPGSGPSGGERAPSAPSAPSAPADTAPAPEAPPTPAHGASSSAPAPAATSAKALAAPPVSAPSPSTAPAASKAATSTPPLGEPSGADAAADALYQRAHALHFQAGNWAAARTAWEAYLAAAPGGRFATFAHYNRALCLLRLGQTGEARRVLSLFASGAFGGYRRAEAQSLLDALDAVKTGSGGAE